jgi:chemotaxis response regulator CheB
MLTEQLCDSRRLFEVEFGIGGHNEGHFPKFNYNNQINSLRLHLGNYHACIPYTGPAAQKSSSDNGIAPKDNFFPGVAIGASAGGLEAHTDFFHALPVETGWSLW